MSINEEIKSNSISPHKLDKSKSLNNNSIYSEFLKKHEINLKEERNKYKLFTNQNTLNSNIKKKLETGPNFQNSPQKRKASDQGPSLKEIINTDDYKPTSNNIIQQNTSLEKDASNVNTKLHRTSKSVYEPRKIRQYDIDGSVYDFVKTHDKIKVGSEDGDFMKRMVVDVFIRQTKDKRLNDLLEKKKIRIDESDKIKAFNRLIEDANRRMEAIDNLESVKLSMEAPLPEKKYTYEQFMEVYNRMLMKNLESVKEIDEQRKEKLIKETESEQQLLESMKGKKAPKEEIEKIIDRLYSDAERRKLARESKLEEIEKVQNNDDTPTKYKKKIEQVNDVNNKTEEQNNIKYVKTRKTNGMNNVEFNNTRFSRAESPNIKRQNLSFMNPSSKISKTPTKVSGKPNQFRMQKIVMNTDIKTEFNFEENKNNEVKLNDLKNFRNLNKYSNPKKFVPFDKAELYVESLLKKK